MSYLYIVLRFCFFAIFVRFISLIILGVQMHGKRHIPRKGPAILVANHNSHLDTLVLCSAMPLRLLGQVRPVAAADYFLKNRLISWFSRHILRIIPVERRRTGSNPLDVCSQALEAGNILIIFPEGTRGEPGQTTRFRKGIAYLAERHPHVPIIPIYIKGVDKALPKGEALLVPFICDLYVGEPHYYHGDKEAFRIHLQTALHALPEKH